MFEIQRIGQVVRLFFASLRGEPGISSFDGLRSALVHDPERKLSIQAGRLGAAAPGPLSEPERAFLAGLLSAVDLALRENARFLVQRFPLLWAAAGLGAGLAILRRRLRQADPFPASTADLSVRLVAEHARVSKLLSAPHAVDFVQLGARAVREIQEEISAGDPASPLRVELAAGEPPVVFWVPRAAAQRWLDLLRNLLRNAVHATEERWRGAPDFPAVRLLLRRRANGEVSCEVIDQGAGMSPELLEEIWSAGASTRGPGRGHGLTEEKRRFIDGHAALEVRSREGVGTAFVLDLRKPEIALRAPALHQCRPVQALALALLVAVGGVALSVRGEPSLESVELVGPRTVRGLDDRKHPIWERELPDEIQRNDRGPLRTPGPLGREIIARRSDGRVAAVVLATSAEEGPGSFWFLRADGRPYFHRMLQWVPPVDRHLDRLICWWRVSAPWPGAESPVAVLHIRDSRYAPSATFFYALNGDSLGAYYHPGHLTCRAITDLDGDGRTEVLLVGINNPAQQESPFIAPDPGVYIDCLSLLEVPRVGGQAWPHQTWSGIEPAQEEAYLLLPPLAPGIRPEILEVVIGSGDRPEGLRLEVVLGDGRIYLLDAHLRPLACRTGDNTRAREMGIDRPVVPLLWMHDGRSERVDLPVQGATS